MDYYLAGTFILYFPRIYMGKMLKCGVSTTITSAVEKEPQQMCFVKLREPFYTFQGKVKNGNLGRLRFQEKIFFARAILLL